LSLFFTHIRILLFCLHLISSSDKELRPTENFRNEAGEEVTRFTKPAQEKVNHSNPSFGQLPNPYGEDTMDLSSQVIKVYRGDHTSRFFVLTKVCFVYTPQSVFPSGRNRPKRQSVGAYFWQYDSVL